MTVQQLIDKLNEVTDTNKEITDWFECPVVGVTEYDNKVIINS